MRTTFNFLSIGAAVLVLSITSCSQGDGDSIEGSSKYRILNENQFLIEASGHWLTSNGLCSDEVTVDGLGDIKLSRTKASMNGGTIHAGWQQIEDIEPLMHKIRRFAQSCDGVDEDSINVAFLQLHTGPIKQVVAVSEQRHMFIVDEDGEVTYWRPFKDVNLASLDIDTEESAELTGDIEPAKVDYTLGDEEGRFNIDEQGQ